MNTSALSEWMIVRSFMSLVQLRANPNESGFQTGILFIFYILYQSLI